MKNHAANATYGVLDYAAYPVAMLLAAPTLLRHLGIQQYGVWIVCTAAVSTGGIIAAGFGDANIQHVATERSRGHSSAVVRTVRSMMGINFALGSAITLLALTCVRFFAERIVPAGSNLHQACITSLSLACLLMLVRAIESVCMSTQRAFERYGVAVGVSLAGRVLTIAFAVISTRFDFGVTGIMLFTVLFTVLGAAIQLLQLKRLVNAPTLWPEFDRSALDALFGFGIFSWFQAISTVLFSQADRLFLGAALGAATVTSYALCVQMAQPIYGITAAGFHFLFPYLASKRESETPEVLRGAVKTAFVINLAFVAATSTVFLVAGRPLLRAWVGVEIANGAAQIFAPIVWSFAFLALSVTAYYALMAFGRIRTVALINLYGGLAMLFLLFWLPQTGIRGVAIARLAYGAISLTLYYPLVRLLRSRSMRTVATPGFRPFSEEA